MTDTMKQTPLNAVHKALGARMVPFGGWEMPVQYAGVIEEHLAVRERAGLFDVSHMGEVEVSGPEALALVQRLTTNDAARLVDGQIQYSALCYPDGGVVDDVTLYRSSATHFLFCVNASNTDKDFAWMQQVHAESGIKGATLTNRSAEFAQLALQGPAAAEILGRLTSGPLTSIRYYHFSQGEVAGVPTLISRTGYTGEDGFELYIPASAAVGMWNRLLEAGRADGLMPIGLGARDTLRLEKGYALYGHELSSTISPLEAGLGWIVKLDKGDFVGRDALLKQKAAGLPRRLVGLAMEERGIPREGYPVYAGEKQVGAVTSGTMSPSLKNGIALALIESPCAVLDKELLVGIRDRKLRAKIVKPPFVKK
ncbi:MAG: glycine cleavage system aminomethyltransferase GcvT [Desulfuromonadales bacterium]|nr:glycine cleavage system aminomethyltransferase GcvT [Desulfuromonadales bacterium]